MPKVPYPNNVVPIRPQADQPAPEFLAMAAAVMHEQGRLFEPPATFNERFADKSQFVKEVAKEEWPITQMAKRGALQFGLEGEAERKRRGY